MTKYDENVAARNNREASEINLLSNYINLCVATQKLKECFLDEERCKEAGCSIWWNMRRYKEILEVF